MTSILCAALVMASALPAADVPARIVDPTPQSRAALAEAVRSALNGAPVTLADEALTAASTLLIERAVRRDARGLRIQGRELTPPEQFHLVQSAGACVLVHERTGRRFPLRDTRCVPAG